MLDFMKKLISYYIFLPHNKSPYQHHVLTAEVPQDLLLPKYENQ